MSKKYIQDLDIDWNRTRRVAFNDRTNPDDDELGIQIVKDLHRTGCSAFSGHENDQDRALLKRVLLAYARYNKSVGYCQGFNIIAALILEIVDRKEEDALMCMIYLIDHILPEGYFTNSMHTLAVDMTVFRELLKQRLPKLYIHLNQLQFNSMTNSKLTKLKKKTVPQVNTYEPPLTNVFTMQWFLTLFATCLPKNVLLRVWDCVFLYGSEVLFRTSLSIWDKLSVSIMKATSADSFYSMMSVLSMRLFDQNTIEENNLIDKIFSYGSFPLEGLSELRERFTFNINPFQNFKKEDNQLIGLVDHHNHQMELKLRSKTDREHEEIDDLAKMISCFALLMPNRSVTSSQHKDIMIQAVAAANTFGSKKKDNSELNLVTPGAISFVSQMYNPKPLSEQLTMDLNELNKQYKKLKERQKQAQIIIQTASDQHRLKQKKKETNFSLQSPPIINHLLIKPTDMNKNTLKTSVHLKTDNVISDKLIEKIHESKILVENILHLDQETKKSTSEYFTDDDSSDQDEVISVQSEKKLSFVDLSSKSEECKSHDSVACLSVVANNENKHRKLSRESSKSANSAIIDNLVREESRNLTPLNPFPIRHLNSNVAKNGHRLGLYK